ncbi:uncharacterized protein MONBRDRAFT_44221 [Monosiga brevicollis MX1]|uniref:Uncharacterized protein n=1 Tax=Monosiga brevicollis TaxID=81824 RepID=A9US46_MONBE|nr:uncharacterized protein MONBRDRAFT_44221 [Monosiga brevicollis MX1]EDQ91717.1 predicted protein [Monosiga brevicollis MX1]|eukprot:XP_001743003.1 hypothetical protein [Monosiga brevicollis MX1]
MAILARWCPWALVCFAVCIASWLPAARGVPVYLTIQPNSMDENTASQTAVSSITVFDFAYPTGPHTIVLQTFTDYFAVQGNAIYVTQHVNFEQVNQFALRIRATDPNGGGQSFDVALRINDKNDPPTGLVASSNLINLNHLRVGDTIATLSVEDEDNLRSKSWLLNRDTQSHSIVLCPNEPASAWAQVEELALKLSAAPGSSTTGNVTICFRVSDDGDPVATADLTVDFVLEAASGQAPATLIVQPSPVELPEDTPLGAIVAEVLALDTDETRGLTFALTSAQTNSPFALDTASTTCENITQALRQTLNLASNWTEGLVCRCNITLQHALDYETTQSWEMTLVATDSQELMAAQTVRFNVSNVDDPPTDIVFNRNSVNENVPAGSLLGQLAVIDPDQLPAFRLNVPLLRSTTLLNGSSCAAVVLADLDVIVNDSSCFNFERSAAVVFVVGVKENSDLNRSIVLAIEDLNEAPLAVALRGAPIAEDAERGALIGQLDVVDPDTSAPNNVHSCSIIDPDSSFSVVNETSLVLQRADLDYERAASVSVAVTCTDHGNPAYSITATVVVLVANVNEAPDDLVLSANAVAEDSVIGTVVGQLQGIDPDNSGAGNETFRYCLWDATNGCVPTMARLTILGNVLVTAALLDYETQPWLSVTIAVFDSGNLTLHRTFIVQVLDRNEPPTNLTLSAATVPENSPGAMIGELRAHDPDVGQTLSFSIQPAFGTQPSYFRILNSQQLALAEGVALDYETTSSVRVRVEASDNAAPTPRTVVASFEIIVLNMNEEPRQARLVPMGANASSAAEPLPVTEGPISAMGLAWILVEDPDNTAYSAELQSHSCTLVQVTPSTAAFTIDAHNVLHKSPAELDFESQEEFTLLLRCTDDGLPPQAFQDDVTLQVTNLNEAPSAIFLNSTLASAQVLTLPEGPSTVGRRCGVLSALDPDNCDAARCRPWQALSLQSLDPRFIIVAGELVLAEALDFEIPGNAVVTLLATDDGVPALSLEVVVPLVIEDRNDPITGINLSRTAVPEDSRFLATVSVSDQDSALLPTGQHVLQVLSPSSVEAHGLELWLIEASPLLNAEAATELVLQLAVQDQSASPLSAEFEVLLTVLDVNEPPSLALQLERASITENTAPLLLAQLDAFDPEGGSLNCTANATGLSLASGCVQRPRVQLEADTYNLVLLDAVDFECSSMLQVWVECQDLTALTTVAVATFAVDNVLEPPTGIALTALTANVTCYHNGTVRVPELTAVGTPLCVISCITVEAAGTCTVALGAGPLQLNESQLVLGADLDFENQAAHMISVTLSGSAVLQTIVSLDLVVGDVNEPITGIDIQCGCANFPCLNDGVCQEDGTAFTCDCAYGYTGARCHMRSTEANTSPSWSSAPALDPTPCLRYSTAIPSGTELLRVVPIDPDHFDTHTFELLSGTPGLALSPTSGIVTVNGPLFAASPTVRVQVQDAATHKFVTALSMTADPCARGVAECPLHSYCVAEGTGYSCPCDTGYVVNGSACVQRTCLHALPGSACTAVTDTCYSRQCQNDATCVDGTTDDGRTTFSCVCPEGYGGFRCDSDIDDCVSAPCGSGATCVDQVGEPGFRCTCGPGMGGHRCLVHSGSCATVSCSSGSTCVPAFNATQARCAPNANIVVATYHASTNTCASEACSGVWQAESVDFANFLDQALGAPEILVLLDVSEEEQGTVIHFYLERGGDTSVVIARSAIQAACEDSTFSWAPMRLAGFCHSLELSADSGELATTGTTGPTLDPSGGASSTGAPTASPSSTASGTNWAIGLVVVLVVILLVAALIYVARHKTERTSIVTFDRPAVAFENPTYANKTETVLGAHNPSLAETAWDSIGLDDDDDGTAPPPRALGWSTALAEPNPVPMNGSEADEADEVGYIQIAETGDDGIKSVRTVRRSRSNARTFFDPVFANPLYDGPSEDTGASVGPQPRLTEPTLPGATEAVPSADTPSSSPTSRSEHPTPDPRIMSALVGEE